MTRTVDERLVLAHPEGPEFFRDAIEAYGREGAREICETILDSLEKSQRLLPMLRPVHGLKLSVTDQNPIADGMPVQPFAVPETNSVALAFHPDASVEDIVADLLLGIPHEVAHLAHAQLNPEFEYDASLFHFSMAISEGIARHAELTIQEPDYSTGYVWNLQPVHAEQLYNGLIDALYDGAERGDNAYFDFLVGDEQFPLRGYQVGHFVVASRVELQGEDMRKLMLLPLEDWKTFAETEL